jgi:hypothetical protein
VFKMRVPITLDLHRIDRGYRLPMPNSPDLEAVYLVGRTLAPVFAS